MQIVFFCPPVTMINGGIKRVFRMCETLGAAGFDAIVFEEQGRRPAWFPSTAPIAGQGIFNRDAEQIYVLPEDQPNILALFKDWPQRKVIDSQNHFFGVLGIGNANSFADYGASHILCCSKITFDHAKKRHPSLKAHLIPCGIDTETYKTRVKQKRILYMPRKRPVEALFIRDMFRFAYPEYRDWEWQEVKDKPEDEVVKMMGEAGVFLSLGRLEGLGLTPLEAMASGCVVAGFTGVGGREYATTENGFWADEDDLTGCVEQLKKAVDLASLDNEDETKKAYRSISQRTLKDFTVLGFNAATLAVWKEILS